MLWKKKHRNYMLKARGKCDFFLSVLDKHNIWSNSSAIIRSEPWLIRMKVSLVDASNKATPLCMQSHGNRNSILKFQSCARAWKRFRVKNWMFVKTKTKTKNATLSRRLKNKTKRFCCSPTIYQLIVYATWFISICNVFLFEIKLWQREKKKSTEYFVWLFRIFLLITIQS